MTAKIFVNNGRAEYTPPVIDLISFALEQGFALSAKIINKSGRTTSAFENNNDWYNPSQDKGVGNEFFKDDWTLQ